MIKNYNTFVNEELNLVSYKLASDRLSDEFHSERKQKLEEHYEELLNKIPPFDIIEKNNNKWEIFEKCKITEIKLNNIKFNYDDYDNCDDDDNYDNCDPFIIILNNEKNNKNFKINIEMMSKSKLMAQLNGIKFSNRKEARRFFVLVKSIIDTLNITSKKNMKFKVNINDSYISEESWERIIDEQTNVEEEEEENWGELNKEVGTGVNFPVAHGRPEEEEKTILQKIRDFM